MVNGAITVEDSPPIINSSPSLEASGIKPVNRPRPTRCSLIKEELCEEDEDELSRNHIGFEEVNECHSANALPSDSDTNCASGKLSPSSPSSAVNTRLLQTVHSMPQLVLNQISEEDEDEEMPDSSLTAPPQHRPIFSIAGMPNFGGCAKKPNRKSAMKTTASVQSRVVSGPKLGDKSGNGLPCIATTDAQTGCRSVADEAGGRPWTAVIGLRRNSCSGTDNEDDSLIRVKHFCLQPEPIHQQHSLVQSTSDTEALCDGYTDLPVLCGTTNSLDRRLFQNARKDGRSVAGRSIVGAVKKSVGALLGHLSAVGDVTSAKPRRIETWSSCSDLMQASAKLRCANNNPFMPLNMANRQRVAGCQLARELRQNRSEREAQFNDANKAQLSSHVIRVRSRDFDTLVSKFTDGDQTTATSTRTETS